MKGKRIIASLNPLQRYAKEGDNFLDRIVTGDETWVLRVLHYTPESKQRSMVWKHNVMLTAFWDCHGPLVLDFMPRGATINADILFHTVTSVGCDQKEALRDYQC